MERTLFRRRIMPPEVPDGQKGEHRRVNAGGEQEGRETQFHRRVVGPHPDAQEGVREGVSESLRRGQQPCDAAHQPKGHRRGESPQTQAEIELHRAH